MSSQSQKYDALRVEIFPDPASMGTAVAEQVAAILNGVLQTKATANVILATGNSMLSFLGALKIRADIPWQRVNIFHMDEYLGMTASHSASFRRFLREKIVDPVQPRTFEGIAGDALDASKECRRYEARLREYPADLCCLGIGENGHLAFNDPPVADFNDPVRVKIVALDHACRMQQVGEGHFASLQDTPQYAITLTIPALLSAARVLAIVPEKRKAPAVKAALTGPVATACPASILRTAAHAQLFLDVDSASRLA
jgi:glucosamine-6-phosphate deaminase